MENKNNPLVDAENESIKDEEFSESEDVIKATGGDVAMADEETAEAIEAETGADATDEEDKNFGFHIE